MSRKPYPMTVSRADLAPVAALFAAFVVGLLPFPAAAQQGFKRGPAGT